MRFRCPSVWAENISILLPLGTQLRNPHSNSSPALLVPWTTRDARVTSSTPGAIIRPVSAALHDMTPREGLDDDQETADRGWHPRGDPRRRCQVPRLQPRLDRGKGDHDAGIGDDRRFGQGRRRGNCARRRTWRDRRARGREPRGYQGPHAFKLGSILLALDAAAETKDVVVIRELTVEAPDIVYDKGPNGSNVEAIQNNIDEYSRTHPTGEDLQDAAKKDAGASARRFIVESLQIRNGKIRLPDRDAVIDLRAQHARCRQEPGRHDRE